MAAISAIAGKGIRVPAYAGCISRLLAPKVARPSRRPRSALQLHAPASRRVPHSVSQPTPPQGTSAPATNPRRHGLSNSVAPGACCAVTLRTAPSPLRASPSAVFPRLRKSRSGSCSAGDEKNEKSNPSMHVNQRFCTFVREYVDNLPALRAKRRPVFQSVSCREERPEAAMWKTPACAAYNERTGRRAALYHWRFSAPSRFHVEGSGRS